jgi:hypothetical protein
MAKSWIKLTKSGTAFGLSHFIGDVVELGADKAKEVMFGAGGIPAEAEEIEKAKAAIAKSDAAEAAAKGAEGPTNADLLAQIVELKLQLAAQLEAKDAKK